MARSFFVFENSKFEKGLLVLATPGHMDGACRINVLSVKSGFVHRLKVSRLKKAYTTVDEQ